MLVKILVMLGLIFVGVAAAHRIYLNKVQAEIVLAEQGELEDIRRLVRLTASYFHTSALWPGGVCSEEFTEVKSCGNRDFIKKFPQITIMSGHKVRAKCVTADPTQLIIETVPVSPNQATGAASVWKNLFPSVPFIFGMKASVTVHSQEMLYFRFDQSVGFMGEQGNVYRPTTISLAPEITSLKVNATGLWQHDPLAAWTDAEGVVSPPTSPILTSLPYYRTNIQPAGKWNCGLLIGMWSDLTPNLSTDLLTPFPIGNSRELKKPPSALDLTLGFHDGSGWYNNSGVQNVELMGETCVK